MSSKRGRDDEEQHNNKRTHFSSMDAEISEAIEGLIPDTSGYLRHMMDKLTSILDTIEERVPLTSIDIEEIDSIRSHISSCFEMGSGSVELRYSRWQHEQVSSGISEAESDLKEILAPYGKTIRFDCRSHEFILVRT